MTDDEKAAARRAYARAYYRQNREKWRDVYGPRRKSRTEYMCEQHKAYYWRLKGEVFAAYGNCCACCGEDNPGFLTVDHVNGGGGAHRKAVGGATMVWLSIIKQGFPADYQLLCFNCNLGRNLNGGICPHKTLRAV